jgi:hypothetical protein
VPVGQDITAKFSEDVDPTTISGTTFLLKAGSTSVAAAVTYDSATDTATLNPTSDLLPNTTYTATLKGGTTGTVVKDRAGNALAGDYTWSFKTFTPNTAPTTPGAPALASGSSTPNQGAFTLDWTASTDADNNPVTYTLEHKDANDANFSNVATSLTSNSYTFPATSKEAEGTWTYRVLASDGTVSTPFSGASSAIKVDRTAPSAPSASFDRPPEYDQTGTTNDWFKDTVTVSYSGSSDPALPDGSAGSGVASYNPTSQIFTTDGANAYSGTATDNAGNGSSAASGSVNVDSKAPTASASFDRAPEYNLDGTSGDWFKDTVTVSYSGTDSGSGIYSSGTSASQTLTADGANAYSGTVKDNVGHVSDPASGSVNVDSKAPSAPSASFDRPPEYDQTGTANDWFKDTVTVSYGGVTDSGSGIDSSSYSASQTLTADGANAYSGTVKDNVGHESAAASGSVNVDPTDPTISAGLDKAPVNGWFNKSTGAPTVHFDCKDTLSGIKSCPADYTFGEGSNQSKAGTAYDNVGKFSSDSVTGIYVDLTAPARVAAPDLVADDDTGSSDTDNETSVTTPEFTGKAEANSTVTLYNTLPDGTTEAVGSVKADASGNWTITSSTLDEGKNSMTAKATDAAGNDSPWSATVEVTIVTVDTAAPAAPSGLDLDAYDDSGKNDDNITNVTKPKFSGTAEPGSSVDIYDDASKIGTVTATTGGSWSFTPSTALIDGTHPITAKATDTAGNTSENYSTALSVTIDTKAPAITDGGASASADGNADWYKTAVTNKFSASDTGGSGLADTSQANFTKSSGTDEGSAVKISSGSVSDVAGNSNSGIYSAAFKIDLHAPVISDTDINDTTWRNTDRTASYTASDSVSGLYSTGDASFALTASAESTATTPTTDSRTVYDIAGHSATRTLSAFIDKSAPKVNDGGPTTSANSAGWYNTEVINRFTATDSLSGLANAADASFTKTTTGEGSAVKVNSGDVSDKAGNKASADSNTFQIDKTAPTLNPSVSPNPVLLNGSATVSAGASDSLSGLASAATCGSVDTSSVGSKSVECSATDKAGNNTKKSANYSVNYKFDGFRQPVDNKDASGAYIYNVAKAGSAIPLKFSLSGNQGLSIIKDGAPKVSQVNCATSAPTDTIEELATVANSGLTYDATADQYNYVWKTPTTYAGKCYKLDMVLTDGTSHVAYFKFTK